MKRKAKVKGNKLEMGIAMGTIFGALIGFLMSGFTINIVTIGMYTAIGLILGILYGYKG